MFTFAILEILKQLSLKYEVLDKQRYKKKKDISSPAYQMIYLSSYPSSSLDSLLWIASILLFYVFVAFLVYSILHSFRQYWACANRKSCASANVITDESVNVITLSRWDFFPLAQVSYPNLIFFT